VFIIFENLPISLNNCLVLLFIVVIVLVGGDCLENENILVVVDIFRKQTILFQGKNLMAHNSSDEVLSSGIEPTLVITCETKEGKTETIGCFRKWEYWIKDKNATNLDTIRRLLWDYLDSIRETFK